MQAALCYFFSIQISRNRFQPVKNVLYLVNHVSTEYTSSICSNSEQSSVLRTYYLLLSTLVG
jgi:hypothetical protein